MRLRYLLPENLRKELKKPLGILLRNSVIPDFLSKLRGDLITVGDVCSLKALKLGKRPRIMVVDFRTLRREVHEHQEILSISSEYRRIKVKNPPGSITDGILRALSRAILTPQRTLILVEGEEDLAALPAICLAPQGSWIMYGQPGEGAVFIRVDGMVKKACLEFLKRMEVVIDGDDRGVQEV